MFSFECMWLWLRPKRLTRSLSGVAACLIYNPPVSSAQAVRYLDEYFINSIGTSCVTCIRIVELLLLETLITIRPPEFNIKPWI